MVLLENIKKELTDLNILINNHIDDELIKDAEIYMRITGLYDKVEELNTSIRSLLDLWEQTRGVLIFFKWLIGISGSIVAVITFFKGTKV